MEQDTSFREASSLDEQGASDDDIAERALDVDPPRHRPKRLAMVGGIFLLAAAAIGAQHAWHGGSTPAAAPPPAPPVTVSTPLRDSVAPTIILLGQFSAVDSVDLRAQVGGVLTAITFKDGQIVHKGDPLFQIDPRPFEIKLAENTAQLQTAQAKETLAQVELWRARELKQTQFGTVENVDQRVADQNVDQAAIESAKAEIMDAQLDLEFAHVTAPFSGRIGMHQVSVGSLVSGSRGGSGPSTLLGNIVSLDPIYLDFDMSEADYRAYQRTHGGSEPHDDIAIGLDGDEQFTRHGTFDFIDNAVDRSSGTIHGRATVANADLALTPGQFARVRIPLGHPVPVLLVPAAAVLPDQSGELVMTVAPNGTVVPKPVQVGDLHHGLRVIRGGLAPTDRVIIDGLVRARPGAKVTPTAGTIVPTSDSDPQ